MYLSYMRTSPNLTLDPLLFRFYLDSEQKKHVLQPSFFPKMRLFILNSFLSFNITGGKQYFFLIPEPCPSSSELGFPLYTLTQC